MDTENIYDNNNEKTKSTLNINNENIMLYYPTVLYQLTEKNKNPIYYKFGFKNDYTLNEISIKEFNFYNELSILLTSVYIDELKTYCSDYYNILFDKIPNVDKTEDIKSVYLEFLYIKFVLLLRMLYFRFKRIYYNKYNQMYHDIYKTIDNLDITKINIYSYDY